MATTAFKNVAKSHRGLHVKCMQYASQLASEPAWDPARSLFLSPQPLYNTKRSLRRRLNPPDFTYSLKKIIMTKWYLSQNQQHITPFSEKEEMWVNREFLTNWNPTNHSSVFSLPLVVKMPRTLCIPLHVLIHNTEFVLTQISSIRFSLSEFVWTWPESLLATFPSSCRLR